MTAKEYLYQAIYYNQMIIRTQEKIKEIKEKAASPGAIQYDRIRVQTTPAADPLADYMAAVDKAERKLARILDRYVVMYGRIERQILEVQPDVYRQVLAMRYLDGMTLGKIARKLNYSYEYIKHVHGRALQAFERKYSMKGDKGKE